MIKKALLISLLIFFVKDSASQAKSYPFIQLYQLDSIAHTNSIARHFGELYAGFLRLVEDQLKKEDTTTQRLVRNFETVFAQFYIDAAQAYIEKKEIPHPFWKKYFEDSNLSRTQYYLFGTNAHLNGQLSEAIANSYTPDEWKKLKSRYVIFKKCLNITYRYVYFETMEEHSRARLLRLVTLGQIRHYGKYLMYKWRRRQIRLTEYLYKDSPKYESLRKEVTRIKERLDKVIVRELY